MEHDLHLRRLLAMERRARLAADYGAGRPTPQLTARSGSALGRLPRRSRRRLVTALHR